MSLKRRATKCSGYIPPSQYVPVYSRPLRTSNVRWHEELSPITPKPSFDDPDNTRARSIQQAVKAWLESSPKSVIGVRGRSPTDSPRISVSSPDWPAATAPDGGLHQASSGGDINFESPTFQKHKLTAWREIVGGGSQSKDDDDTSAQNKLIAEEHSIKDEKLAVKQKNSTVQEGKLGHVIVTSDIDFKTDYYSLAITEALKSSPKAPESYLKPPRVLEKAIVLYGGEDREETVPLTVTAFDRCEGNIEEIRGKELEDFHACGYKGMRHGSGGDVPRTALMKEGGDDFASDPEFPAEEEANERSGFMSSAVSSPISLFEERRFGGEGMNLIQIAGSGEFAAESVSRRGYKTEPGNDSSPATHDFDLAPGAENRRHARFCQSRRTTQPPYETVSVHSRLSIKQEERCAQSGPSSGLSAQCVNRGKRDGPTKTAAVVPVPEDSLCTEGLQEKPTTPLEGVDSYETRMAKQPFNRQHTLERVRKDKLFTKAAAWEEAKNSEFLNRYKREETKISAWEDHKKAKAEIGLKKVELKLQEKRAKAVEKMENEMAKARRKAEEKKAIAEAKRAEKAARAAEEAEIIRQHGRRPLSLLCFTP